MTGTSFKVMCCTICFILLTSMFQATYSQTEPQTDQNLNVRYVSIINLIANPFRFHDSVVRVIGHVRLSAKGVAVYLTKSDAEYELTKNGLWLYVDETMQSRVDGLDMQVCGVVGKFDANNTGPQGLWNGSFTKVIAIGPLNKD
ncbi:MAG: hypothetical protein JW938_03720 [Candidatus Omnitrophica bacterium]|nr:hypothetical protein [Candidatus Omnitrophota bacterium]